MAGVAVTLATVFVLAYALALSLEGSVATSTAGVGALPCPEEWVPGGFDPGGRIDPSGGDQCV